MEMYLTDLVHHILVVEGDETKAPMSVGHLVIGQHRLFHLGEGQLNLDEEKAS